MAKGFPETEQRNTGAPGWIKGLCFGEKAQFKAREGQRKQMAHSGNVSRGWWEREQGPIS